MKKLILLCVAVVAVSAMILLRPREHTLVILTTTDIHAQIDRIPQLVTAVKACRDTVPDAILLDAGDRWTGNPFVDRTEVRGLPVIQLLNPLNYDVATLGNHDFDFGQAALGRMIDSMRFAITCANVLSDTCTFDKAKVPAYRILERQGVRIGVVGVITNYEGEGYPAGKMRNFAGLRFLDPMEVASDVADTLRSKVDVLVLLSHAGDDHDTLFLQRETRYDLVVSGHSHKKNNKVVNGTRLTQSYKQLLCVGAVKIRMRGRRVTEITYENIPLSDYEPDPETQAAVERYYDTPELREVIGSVRGTADKEGIGHWIIGRMRAATRADIGLYHWGGIRVDSIAEGPVERALIYYVEPFDTRVAMMEVKPEALRRIIIAKFNDRANLTESHRIDLFCSTPYTIVTDPSTTDAVDVLFPELDERRTYRVVFNEYINEKYAEIDRTKTEVLELLINDLMLDAFRTQPQQTMPSLHLQEIR